MSIPDIHNCAQMVVENERLKKMLRKIKKENKDLQEELEEFKEKQKMATMLREYCTTRNMEVQTDPVRVGYQQCHVQSSIPVPAGKKPEKRTDNEKMNKMLILHNNLMKRYEKELKTNMEHMEHISSLNQKITDLESRLKEEESQKPLNKRGQALSARGSNVLNQDISSLLAELNQVRKQKEKLSKEITKLKKELGGLDHDFFEEIEDMKYALQQSAKLNQAYEKSLQKLCRQFGVPVPDHRRLVLGQD